MEAYHPKRLQSPYDSGQQSLGGLKIAWDYVAGVDYLMGLGDKEPQKVVLHFVQEIGSNEFWIIFDQNEIGIQHGNNIQIKTASEWDLGRGGN